jgi:hypothetical protein
LGNKKENYNQADAEQLHLIGADLWSLVKRHRTEAGAGPGQGGGGGRQPRPRAFFWPT